MKDLSGFSMLDLFRQEAEAQTAILNAGLLELEQGGAASAGLEALMRAAHSLKGAARIVGLDPAVKVAHALEDCFVAAQKQAIAIDSPTADILLRAVDLLGAIAAAPDDPAAAWRANGEMPVAQALRKLAQVLHPDAPPDVPAPADSGENVAPAGPAPAGATQPTAAAPAESPPAAVPAPGAPSAVIEDRTVRVAAESLSRLLEMAGEALVRTRWHAPHLGAMALLKTALAALARQIEQMAERIRQRQELQPAECAELIRQVAEIRKQAGAIQSDFEFFAHRSADLNERIYQEIVASRMRPLADGAQGFPRMVRDLARRLGKQVKFEIVGQDTAVDREILARLEAPLTHLLRNALDHGLETPAERQAAGKPPAGRLQLEARHHAGQLWITVADDGRGLNIEGIRRKAAARGLSAPETLARMSDEEVLDFLFLPGFSTAASVSEISGRGVGLDVVQNLARELGGAARLENRPGRGAAVHLHLPITLSVLRVILVEISGAPYALPLTRVARLIQAAPGDWRMLEGRRYLPMEGRDVGVVDAAAALELPPSASRQTWPVVMLAAGADIYGLAVDRLLGECKLVVRRLDDRLGKVRDINAAALLDDGTPVLILDADDLARSIETMLGRGGLKNSARPAAGASEQHRKAILVADDSITVREIERRLLENRGYQVDTAVDGMEAWNSLREHPYDLLVTDVDMPRLNGIDLVRNLRQDARLRELPVVVVSYKDQEEDRRRGMEAGANYYLTKSSFQDETFVRAIADLLGA